MSAPPLDPSAHSTAVGLTPALRELDGLVDRLVANQRAMAELDAERAELFAAAADVIPMRAEELRSNRKRMSADLPAREVVAELATALRIGERAVQARLTDASLLVSSFPETLAALRDGLIDARHVAVILDAGAAALEDSELRTRFEEMVLPIAARETAARLRGHARELAARVDPEAVDRRKAAAEDRRTVRIYDLDDDLARLVLDQPATLIHAIYDRVTQQAKAMRGGDGVERAESAAERAAGADVGDSDTRVSDGGVSPCDRVVVVTGAGDGDGCGDGDGDGDDDGDADPRTPDQLRADILADMLLTGGPTAHGNGLDAIQAVVQVTVPLSSLFPDAATPEERSRVTPRGGPAILPTFGPIPIGTARTLAGHAPGWERICLDPASGLPVAVDRYTPSARQRAYLAARDGRCRFPGCRRPAHRCDVDHTHDASLGGATCICNLAHFCRRHHTVKHHTAWTVRQLGRGVLEWTSPTGRRYEDRPPTMVRFIPDEADAEAPHAKDPPPF